MSVKLLIEPSAEFVQGLHTKTKDEATEEIKNYVMSLIGDISSLQEGPGQPKIIVRLNDPIRVATEEEIKRTL